MCVGISRYTGKREFFVMTICPKFEIVTLWDLRLNCEFQLLGRISEKEKHLLRKMLISENQLIEKETIFNNSEEKIEKGFNKTNKSDSYQDLKNEDYEFDKHNSKSDLLHLNMDENQDEQDIIENQKIELMQRDIRKNKNKKKIIKKKECYDFLERKKKEENRRLAEAKGGYQIAVHDFYHKGQKGDFNIFFK